MNENEIKILNEIIDNMDKILIEKEQKYQNAWIYCDLTLLKAKLIQQINKLLLPTDLDNELRTLTHIFNYAFFLYCRYKLFST